MDTIEPELTEAQLEKYVEPIVKVRMCCLLEKMHCALIRRFTSPPSPRSIMTTGIYTKWPSPLENSISGRIDTKYPVSLSP